MFVAPSTAHQMSSHASTLTEMEFPFILDTPTDFAFLSSSSSPSSPFYLPTDESSDLDAPHWWPQLAANSASTPAQWSEAFEQLPSDRLPPRVPSPSFAVLFRHDDSTASSEASNSPAATHTQQSVKRKRRNALSVDERLQRRRAQHRAVDANRRQRESDAIARLHRLISKQQHLLTGDVDEESKEAEGDESEDSRHTACRLDVLESSIAMIEQLSAACQRMDAACNAKDLQVSRVSNQLHSVAAALAEQASSLAFVEQSDGAAGRSKAFPNSSASFLSVLPPPASSYLIHSDICHTLRQSTTSLLNNMSATVVTLPSMLVIDVNDAYLSMSGRHRSDVLYHTIDCMSTAHAVPQYPASIAAMNEVIDGSKRHGGALFRCREPNGPLFEFNLWFSAIFDEPLPGAVRAVKKGRRVPDKLLLVSASEEAVELDELHAL